MQTVEQMKKYIKSDDRDFKKFKLNYTNDEKHCIGNFNISKTDTYKYMGCRNDMTNMYTFLNNLGNNSEKSTKIMEKIIMKLLKNILSAFNTEYYWISIRATLPNDDFNIPRWHKDGKYFINSNDQSPKFATVLKGPGTLLIKNTKKVSEIYNNLTQKQWHEYRLIKDKSIEDMMKIHDKYRLLFAKELKKIKFIQTKNNEGIIFYPQIIANTNDGALHSEPKMNAPRLFISILPGSKENIEELNKRWASK